ncbi:MAG: C4-dicarboxylate ABC transporter [Burkholderiaceae bacterium]|jgi:tellurite resistance protein|nr:C4-dicarboxylate ABC transporter [Burkholderiaceae bacterium]
MSRRPNALKYLAPNWFAIVMSLCGLALAWARAAPMLGEAAGAGALAIAGVAALAFALLALLSLVRWGRFAETVTADLRHPVRHAFFATIPMSILLLATCGVALLGASGWLAALWWVGSLGQFGVTLWALARWLHADKERQPGWNALTPALLMPVVGNVLAPLAGPALGAGGWAAAQFGLGLLLWPVLLALLIARIATHGLWPERILPTTFITAAPPAVIGSSALQLGVPDVLAWMCWGVALFFLLWSLYVLRRMLAQPFSVAFWSLGFPLAAFAALSLRLAALQPWMQTPAMIALALASLVIALLVIATFKGLRQGTLLEPEPVAMMAVAGSGQPPA